MELLASMHAHTCHMCVHTHIQEHTRKAISAVYKYMLVINLQTFCCIINIQNLLIISN